MNNFTTGLVIVASVASAVDLDWFWRGWFYTNDCVDISLDQVNWFKINTADPEIENPIAKNEKEKNSTYIGNKRDAASISKTVTEKDKGAVDFYTTYDPFKTDVLDRQDYADFLNTLDAEEKAFLNSDKNYYELQFSNIGGLVMPIILEFTYTDGTQEIVRIPAEIWKRNNEKIKKVFILDKELMNVKLDPFLETADVDLNNNYWPARTEPTRFQLYKQNEEKLENPMQRAERVKNNRLRK